MQFYYKGLIQIFLFIGNKNLFFFVFLFINYLLIKRLIYYRINKNYTFLLLIFLFLQENKIFDKVIYYQMLNLFIL